ncbi:tRNA ligase 1 isoform X2 [Magnolia sinica]|uniref:tRNA ligase 1 isoform X2 n=1 Tax=Magnolia sinica TaxID=86752 RepID=UPI00265A6C3C|nr:tRNA ligase 1 isoform X2 [Magnolia sinica]
MSRILYLFSLCLSSTTPSSHNLILFNRCCSPSIPSARFNLSRALRFSTSLAMLNNQGKAGKREQHEKEKPKPNQPSLCVEDLAARPTTEAITDRLSGLSITENTGPSYIPVSPIQKSIWKPKSYSTVRGAEISEVAAAAPDVRSTVIDSQANVAESIENASADKNSAALHKLFKGPLGENFTVDNLTYSQAQIRATFYPKFENEKTDQDVRTRMIEMISNGLATLEVSLKHSGSLFMYAGHEGGAYAKNSYGNIYTAVGVFVLGRMFVEAWGTEARKIQAEFNDFLEKNRMCISMELVTAVLGDHGQRPLEDYVVVTAVAELGNGKPKFYSTPDIIAFCRKWRLPTNHVWLFSTRKSVTSFFAAYDALCEEGTATPVCKALDDIADISVPGSKDHIKVQGEILEGLVARVVSHESSKHLEKVLKDFPPPPLDGVGCKMGPSLREICAANRSDEKQQIQALLQSAGSYMCPDYSDWFGSGIDDIHSRNADRSVLSKFLQAHPADFSTTKLQEMIRLMRQRHFPAAFKCYNNFHKFASLASDNLYFKMVIHVHSDSVFRRYQREMRHNPGLWPLYRGFFVDINLFKVNKESAAEMAKDSNLLTENTNGNCGTTKLGTDGLADEDANLMIKLKFLTYKLRTFLIRNGLSMLFKEGPAAYRTYYLKQMKTWGTSAAKQRDLSKMLDEWAVYIRRKCGNKQLSSSIYLTEAEPFLEQYAKRSLENQALIGSAGNLVKAEDFLAIVEGGRDEEGDLDPERVAAPLSPSPTVLDRVPKNEGLIVFFPGIPGCAKSALCKEILSAPGGLGDNRSVHSLMGDLIKGKYWQKVADERKKKPYVITLADKNAPNEEVWRQIEGMCRSTRASAVPVVPDSEGTDSNPFSLDALAVFIFRVLQRVNHPGNLDKASPNAGYVLLMFYHLYEGKNRREFESELSERFGSLVKMPLLRNDRSPLPDPVKAILEEGINLYMLHTNRHGRLDSTKGSYAREWAQWEKRLREILFGNAEYLNSIQVPFDVAVKQVLEQLRAVAKGDFATPSDTEKRKFGNIVFAAVTLPVMEIRSFLEKLAEANLKACEFLKERDIPNSLRQCHITLAHKRSHGVTAVASYGVFLNQKVPVTLTALLFSDKLAALEACLGSIDDEKISSKNQWPHVTIWTGEGATAKEANMLPLLVQEGKATRIEIDPTVTISGVLDFY